MAFDCIQVRRRESSTSVDSELALRPSYRESLLLEPISPPPQQMDCKTSLMSLHDNYEKYLNSLPQKQKEYHHLVMAARKSTNYPINKLSAPLLLAKQQRSLIESQYMRDNQIVWSQPSITSGNEKYLTQKSLKYQSAPLPVPSNHPLPAFGQPIATHLPQRTSCQQSVQSGAQRVVQPTVHHISQPVLNTHYSVPHSVHSSVHPIAHSVPHNQTSNTTIHSVRSSPHGVPQTHSVAQNIVRSQPTIHPMPQPNTLPHPNPNSRSLSHPLRSSPHSVHTLHTSPNYSLPNQQSLPIPQTIGHSLPNHPIPNHLSSRSNSHPIPYSQPTIHSMRSSPLSSTIVNNPQLYSQLSSSIPNSVPKSIPQTISKSIFTFSSTISNPIPATTSHSVNSHSIPHSIPITYSHSHTIPNMLHNPQHQALIGQMRSQREANPPIRGQISSQQRSLTDLNKWCQMSPNQRSVIMKSQNPVHTIPEMPILPTIHKQSRSSPKTVRQILTNHRPVFAQIARPPVPLMSVPKVTPMVSMTTTVPMQRFANNYQKFVPQNKYEIINDTINENILKSRLINDHKEKQISVQDNCMEMPLNLKKSVENTEEEEEDDEIQVLSHFRRESQESNKNSLISERDLSRNSSLSSDSIRLRISETPPQESEDNKQKTSEDIVQPVVEQIQTIEDKSEEKSKEITEEMTQKSSVLSEEESEQEFERRLHLILDILIAPKNGRYLDSPPVLTPESMIDSLPQIIDNRFEYPKKVEKPDFVRTLDLIKTRDLKRKPIAYLNSRHPLNEISRSIYAGIATKKSVLDFPASIASEESIGSPVKAKRKRYSLLNQNIVSEVAKRNDWSFVLRNIDLSSPLSQRVVGVLPQFQFR